MFLIVPIFSHQHRAYLAKMQPIWDAERAATAAKANRENMASFFSACYSKRSWDTFVNLYLNLISISPFQIYLAKATGTPIPADF